MDKLSETSDVPVMYDFTLVTTYLPIMSLTVRGCVFVVILYWCTHTCAMPLQAVIVLSASLVYLDVLLLSCNSLDRKCGYLGVCALAYLSQQQSYQSFGCSEPKSVVLWVNDLLWSVLASAEVVSNANSTQMHIPMPVKVCILCVFATVHVVLNCAAVSIAEMLLRVVTYFLLCSLMVLCAPFAPAPQKSSCAVLHLCVSVLFLHVYAMLASALVIVGIHVRLIYTNVSALNQRSGGRAEVGHGRAEAGHGRAEAGPRDREHPKTPGTNHNYSELVKRLQAEKQTQNMA